MICTRCHEDKDIGEFAWKNKARGRHHSHCKQCQKPVSQQHYGENRADYIQRAQNHYQVNRAANQPRVDSHLQTHPCQVCGQTNPSLLGFVTLSGQDDKQSVGRVLGQSWEIVESAISRSRVLCRDCRRSAK